ncbi:MAG: TDT family transporter [Lachnospiraceae bacterium]|nr:TDT family transporter [Lachnospiraceae bacterium]
MIKKIPLPIAGVMLGAAALGNLLQSYSESIRLLCGIIATIIGIFLLIKCIAYPALLKEDMTNPITASVSGTFPMALMLLAGYAKPFIGNSAIYIWYAAIVLHVILIIYFTVHFVFKLDIKKVFASYFIVYVGITVASVSAPVFDKQGIGMACFWFGFISFILLVLLVTYRYVKYKEIPEPARPLFCIYAAPLSLCLAGYIQSVMPKSQEMVIGMAMVASLLYIMVLIKIPQYLKLKFYPSYAAFTFPLVISAIAIKMTMVFLTNVGNPVPALLYLVVFETIIATVFVIYALIRFLLAITNVKK